MKYIIIHEENLNIEFFLIMNFLNNFLIMIIIICLKIYSVFFLSIFIKLEIIQNVYCSHQLSVHSIVKYKRILFFILYLI